MFLISFLLLFALFTEDFLPDQIFYLLEEHIVDFSVFKSTLSENFYGGSQPKNIEG